MRSLQRLQVSHANSPVTPGSQPTAGTQMGVHHAPERTRPVRPNEKQDHAAGWRGVQWYKSQWVFRERLHSSVSRGSKVQGPVTAPWARTTWVRVMFFHQASSSRGAISMSGDMPLGSLNSLKGRSRVGAKGLAALRGAFDADPNGFAVGLAKAVFTAAAFSCGLVSDLCTTDYLGCRRSLTLEIQATGIMRLHYFRSVEGHARIVFRVMQNASLQIRFCSCHLHTYGPKTPSLTATAAYVR